MCTCFLASDGYRPKPDVHNTFEILESQPAILPFVRFAIRWGYALCVLMQNDRNAVTDFP